MSALCTVLLAASAGADPDFYTGLGLGMALSGLGVAGSLVRLIFGR